MLVSQAHAALSAFSQRNAGIGISIELIRRLIMDQIKRSATRFNMLPSDRPYISSIDNRYEVLFSGIFITDELSINFINVENPENSNEFFPEVEIHNLKLQLEGFLEIKSEDENNIEKKLVIISIDYPLISGTIKLIDKKLKIFLSNLTHTENEPVYLWETEQELKDYFEDNSTHRFIEDDWRKLILYFKATSFFSGGYIANAFIDSLNLPDIFKIFNGVKFGEQTKLGSDNTGNLLMFTAESTLNFLQCPAYNAIGQTSVESTAKIENKTTEYQIGEAPTNEGKIIVESKINDTSESLNYPAIHQSDQRTERISEADVFLFTPIEMLKANFDIVKPSVTASDFDNFGPIYWRYSVTASVQSINLSLINNWPIEFRLSIPTEVTGQAGAGVKIGCIRHEAAGAMFDGKIEPFDVNFKIDLDPRTMQVIFVSKIENIKGKNFYFRTFPKLKFPITEIIDFILARAAEYVITEQADKILNVTRIPIANLNILNKFAQISQNNLAGETDTNGNVTIGIKLKPVIT
jgi:hypothetical protein